MQISLLLMQQIAQLFLVLLMGYAVVKTGLLKASDSKVLSVVFVYLVMPCVVLNAFQIGWVMTPDYVIDEMQRGGKTFRRKKLYRVMIRYVAPVMMLVLFLQSTGILA